MEHMPGSCRCLQQFCVDSVLPFYVCVLLAGKCGCMRGFYLRVTPGCCKPGFSNEADERWRMVCLTTCGTNQFKELLNKRDSGVILESGGHRSAHGAALCILVHRMRHRPEKINSAQQTSVLSTLVQSTENNASVRVRGGITVKVFSKRPGQCVGLF